MKQAGVDPWPMFAAILDRHRSSVIDFVYRMLQDQQAAEAVALDVFAGLYHGTKSSSLNTANSDTANLAASSETSFPILLFRAAFEASVKAIREGRVNPRKAGESAREAQADGVAEIRRAVGALPHRERAVLLLHKYQAMDCAQIAAILGCSQSEVGSLLFGANQKLSSAIHHFGVKRAGSAMPPLEFAPKPLITAKARNY